MKFTKLLLFFITITAGLIVKAQTAEEIIKKHIDAIGGKEKLSQVKSLYMESSIDVMGNPVKSTTTILVGKGFKSETDFNGQKIVQCFTDKGGWMINPMTGQTDPVPMPEELFKSGKRQVDFEPFLNYAAQGMKAELLPKDSQDSLYKIRLTSGDSVETTYFISPTTYYISKTVTTGEMMGTQVEVAISYSNYQKTDFGIVLPYIVKSSFGGQSFEATVSKAEVNKAVDPAIFEMPNNKGGNL